MSGSWEIRQGDALTVLHSMPDASFDGVLCDPPYGISFMGKAWDHGVPSKEVWAEVLRVLKPGAFLLAFGGTRTFHRLTCAIEDAGFEIRDCVSYLYGVGFPKSLDISKALDKAAGLERPRVAGGCGTAGSIATVGLKPGEAISGEAISGEAQTWNGYGTALKPAWEPCIVAMKPLDGTFTENALRHGVAGLNIEAGRIEAEKATGWGGGGSHLHDGGLSHDGGEARPVEGRWPANLILDAEAGAMLDHQSGTLKSGENPARRRSAKFKNTFGEFAGQQECVQYRGADQGGASRFFYCAKASRRERDAGLDGFEKRVAPTMDGGHVVSDGRESSKLGLTPKANTHPCLKPLDLNRYLASLILSPQRDTPRRILVPFSGSGSEMIGAILAGWDEAVGIERETDFCAIAEARLRFWTDPGAWEREHARELAAQETFDDLPLFREV